MRRDLIEGAHGRCNYHGRRVGRKEAREKCVVRRCKHFQNIKEEVRRVNEDLDNLFERR